MSEEEVCLTKNPRDCVPLKIKSYVLYGKEGYLYDNAEKITWVVNLPAFKEDLIYTEKLNLYLL